MKGGYNAKTAVWIEIVIERGAGVDLTGRRQKKVVGNVSSGIISWGGFLRGARLGSLVCFQCVMGEGSGMIWYCLPDFLIPDWVTIGMMG